MQGGHLQQHRNEGQYYKHGENIFAKSSKVSTELVAMPYGAFVTKILPENQHKPIDEVNTQLERMGYSIGIRIIDEFFAKSPPNRALCRSFRETLEVIAREGFKMFLGVQGEVTSIPQMNAGAAHQQMNPTGEHTSFSIVLRDNPLADFVILPPQYQKSLWYSNILCGVIRGALEMVNIRVTSYFLRDTLCGDPVTEIKVELKEIVKERYDDDG